MVTGVKRIRLAGHAHTDERGWVVNPIDWVEPHERGMHNLHVASIEPGCTRGNHYHRHSTEWLFVFGGNATLYWRDHQDTSIHEEMVTESEPGLFEIPPHVEHAIRNTSTRTIYLMAFRDVEEQDTVRTSYIS
ncbi:MAG: cupin domain-containing protein [bacterium]